MHKVIALALLFAFQTTQAAQAPDFSLPAPGGERIALSALLEKGPVLLDFWATWCKPCVEAMPKLEEIHQKYSAQGLTIVGINEDGPRGQNRIRPFLKARNITFPIAIDGDGSVMKRLQVGALPTTILIAPDGEIILRQAGYTPANAQDLIQAIETLLPPREDTHD